MSIACYALHIRHPRAHVLPSLTATCQVCTISLKAGLSTYNRFARRTLYPPDSHPTQTDTHIMRMSRQAPAAVTGRLVCKLKAQRQEEGEHELEKCLAITQQLKIGRFILKIDGDGPVCAWLFSLASPRSPPRH